MLSLTLLGLPPSNNQALIVNHGKLQHSHRARSYRLHTTEKLQDDLAQLSATNSLLLPGLKSLEGQQLSLQVQLCGSWFTQKNTIKKKDAENLIKLLIDSLIQALSTYIKIDDSQFFKIEVQKIESDTEQTKIKIDRV